ncbi:BCCT family transporter [Bacillus sp. ISL-18]|uniref:glycine betaine uptake BCCT transporter n=1 Tax=Bacillus sp. ISL-18 TaxID=2819118 RepID=UPI001BEAC7B6|nr:BCCT family transporter [Bacillus sp. ISL-18]MBT2657623.1 BCCT family transporter [Bacillus sp. ISL-18]
MVYKLSVLITVLFVLWGALAPKNLGTISKEAFTFTINNFGWLYLFLALGFLLFAFYLAFGKFGNIRLGSDDDEPEYSNRSWFAMLFSAGMGIGLVFWGVAEPVSHYMDPPYGNAKTADAARLAIRYSFFHWGLHPWAIYTIISLSLAYFQYRKGYAGLISSTFYPLLKEKVKGPIGKAIDILSIIATVFGVATSLGLGALQVNGGLSHLLGISTSTTWQIIIIIVVTVLYLISATTGLDKGILLLSNGNLILAVALLLLTFFLGSTSFLLDTFTVSIGAYIQNLLQMSLRLTPFQNNPWIGNWTLFYWAWWIAWAPFVGMFIARVSKGRTIKEFVLGVLLIPSLFSFIWFSVFGGSALHLEMFEGKKITEAVQNDITSALFVTLEGLPFGTIMSIITTLLIVTFFITSADSATFVLGMLSSEGDLNPSNRVKFSWGILQSSIAIVLLLSGGLESLQTASIVSALPFGIIMALMCVSIYKALDQEIKMVRKQEKDRKKKIEQLIRELADRHS